MRLHLLLALCLPFTALAQTGSIEGTVTIQGSVSRDEMKPSAPAGGGDAYSDSGGSSAPRETSGGSSDSEVENVIVHVDGPAGGNHKPPSTNPQLAQFKKRLVPHVLPVLVGTTVDFPNKDPFNHNVFSLSNVKKFNLGSYKTGQSKSVTFDKPGQVKVYCDIHSQMRAIIQVLENPYFTKPKGDGSYKIENVPAGTYELVARHEKFPPSIKRITVKAGEATKVDFSFQ